MTIRISKTHFFDRGEFSAEKLAQEVLANYTFGDIHPNVIVEEDEIVLLYDLPQYINKLFDTICEECNRQRWDAALILCDSLLEVLPIHVDTLRVKAQVMMTKQNFTDALTLATKAVTLNPKDVYALLLLGNIHNHMGDYKSAIKCYQEVSILKPDDQIVLCNIGSIYLKQEQYEQAICFFEDALKIDSTKRIARATLLRQ